MFKIRRHVGFVNPSRRYTRGYGHLCSALRAATRFAEGGRTRQEVLAMAASGDLGYTVSLGRGEARVTGREKAAPMVLRVTHVFRRVNDRWLLVHRHADPIGEQTAPEAVLQ